MNFSISVVIPNYNGKELLQEILPSVYCALSTLNGDSEVIIVDDSSADGSAEFIRDHFPEIRLIENEHNLGFSGSVNKGIHIATMDLVFILNNDVKLLENYFEPQLPLFQDGLTFGANAAVFNWNSIEPQGGGKLINRHLFKIKANQNYYIQPENYGAQHRFLTMFLSGTNALIDRKKLLLLGGYEDLFSPFYVEDVELSIRAMRMGWKMYYVPDAGCMHQISTTIKKHSKKQKIKLMTLRNKFYMHFIHLQGADLLFWHIQTIAEVIFRTLFLNPVYLKAYYLVFRNRYKLKSTQFSFHQLLERSGIRRKGLFSILSAYKRETLKQI